MSLPRVDGPSIQPVSTRSQISSAGFQVNPGEGGIRPLGNGIVEANGKLPNGMDAQVVYNESAHTFTLFAGDEDGRPVSGAELEQLKQVFQSSTTPDANGFAALIQLEQDAGTSLPPSGVPPTGLPGGDQFNPGSGPISRPPPQYQPNPVAQERQQFAQVCSTLAQHFQEAGGNFFNGGTIDQNELYAAAHGQKGGPEVQQAAQWLINHPNYMTELETQGNKNPDGKISLKDLSLQMNQLGREQSVEQLKYDPRLGQYQQSLATIQQYMRVYDTGGGSFFNSPDGKISLNDLNRVATNGNLPKELRDAAYFMSSNQDLFRLTDTGAKGGRPDGIISGDDVNAMLSAVNNVRAGMPSLPPGGGVYTNPGINGGGGGFPLPGGYNPGFPGFPGPSYPPIGINGGGGFPGGFNPGFPGVGYDPSLANAEHEKAKAKGRGFLGLLKMIPGVGNVINGFETLVGIPKTIGTWLNPNKSFGDKLKATTDLLMHGIGTLPGLNWVGGGYDIAQGIGRDIKWNNIERQQIQQQLGGLPPYQFNNGGYQTQYPMQYAMS